MRLVFFWILVVLLSASFVSSWPCKKLNSSVNELKNFNHSYEFPCMYSGLVDIDPSVDASIFYWFFLSPKPDYSTNLVLWFAGGPGGSGEGSIFGENGPLRWRRDSKGTLGIISDIKNSMVDVSNVIYVDNPLGVGFSNSQEPITKGEQIGDYIVKFMLKFYELYPEQLNQGLIVAGNSYAGHFIPAAAKAIHEYNLHSSSNERKIPLKSLFVEDGYVNPIVQRLSVKDIAFGAGLITPDLLPEYEVLEQSCEYAVYNSPSTAFEKCKSMNNLMSATNGGWDLMDIRYASGKGAPRYSTCKKLTTCKKMTTCKKINSLSNILSWIFKTIWLCCI